MELNTLNELWEAAEAENKDNENKVINYIKGINALVNKNTEIKVIPNLGLRSDNSVEIEFLTPEGDEAFGAGISFSVRTPYSYKTHEYGEPEFSMGCSTMGKVTRAEAPYQICRCYLMAELWNREQETIKLFDTLAYDAYKAASKAQQEYDREQREIEHAAEQKLIDEINSKLVVGYKFSESWEYYGGTKTADFIIDKITPKRYYLKYIESKPDTRYFYDTELKKRTKLNHGILHSTFTGYINTKKLQFILCQRAQGKNDWYVVSCLSGVNCIGSNFEVQSTEDLPEEDQW